MTAVMDRPAPDFRCRKCGHEWIGRLGRIPVVCPKCKAYNAIDDLRASRESEQAS